MLSSVTGNNRFSQVQRLQGKDTAAVRCSVPMYALLRVLTINLSFDELKP
eukprot:m.176629 g.176629  ORF g.176629 m.176629 type:complete len:50 (+) comp39139_c1_seq6:679-828(+)